MSRLRIGHVGLNSYLNRFKMHDSEYCEQPSCIGQEISETIGHFIMHCPNYSSQRDILQQSLQRCNINLFNLKSLLLGEESGDKHGMILRYVIEYVVATGRADGFF